MDKKQSINERPKGEWKDWKCSVCNHITLQTNFNFCPWCGADMRGDKND